MREREKAASPTKGERGPCIALSDPFSLGTGVILFVPGIALAARLYRHWARVDSLCSILVVIDLRHSGGGLTSLPFLDSTDPVAPRTDDSHCYGDLLD